jgi:hypothetical protein
VAIGAGVAAGAGARLRRARVVHPRGVVCTATLEPHPELDAAGAAGLATALLGRDRQRRTATVRLSKSAGTPAALPDLLGIAIRLHWAGSDPPWDLLLATTGRGRLTRHVLRPAGGWCRSWYTSLLPYRAGNRLVWAGAVPERRAPDPPSSLDALRDALASGRPLTFTIVAAAGPASPWRPVATLTVEGLDDAEPSFDPVLNHHPSLTPVPRWVAMVRQRAYAGSRRGRNAPDPAAVTLAS